MTALPIRSPSGVPRGQKHAASIPGTGAARRIHSAPWRPIAVDPRTQLTYCRWPAGSRATHAGGGMEPGEEILKAVEAQQDEWIGLLSELVRQPSPNPPGDTREVAALVAGYLERRGH